MIFCDAKAKYTLKAAHKVSTVTKVKGWPGTHFTNTKYKVPLFMAKSRPDLTPTTQLIELYIG